MSQHKQTLVYFLIFLLVAMGYLLLPFFMPFVLAGIVVVLCYPIQIFFLGKFNNRKYLAAFFSFITVFFFVLLPIIFVGSLIASQVFSWADQFSAYLEPEQWKQTFANINLGIASLIEDINQRFNINVDLPKILQSGLKEIGLFVSKYSPSVLLGTLQFIISFLLTAIFIFVLFAEGSALYRELIILSPLHNEYEHVLAQEIRNTIYGVVYGSFFTALIQAVLATIAYYFLEVQGFSVWGVLTFIAAFVPFVGATSVWLPMALILILIGNTQGGIFLLIYGGLVISGIDNFIKPILIKGKSDIHPVLLFLSVMGGIKLFGPAGILFGPILMAVLLATIKIYKSDFLSK